MRNFRTITVAQLLEALEGEDPEALVVFSTDYGDYCHTQQALPLKGELEEVEIKESGYSNSGFAIIEEEDRDDDEEPEVEGAKYLVIR